VHERSWGMYSLLLISAVSSAMVFATRSRMRLATSSSTRRFGFPVASLME
jgi:hypothetical protein